MCSLTAFGSVVGVESSSYQAVMFTDSAEMVRDIEEYLRLLYSHICAPAGGSNGGGTLFWSNHVRA